jgi:hypothetical protein
MGQDECRPVLHGELQEGTFQLIAVDQLAQAILDGRLIDDEDRDLERSPSPAPDLVLTGVDEEPMEPGVEPITVA